METVEKINVKRERKITKEADRKPVLSENFKLKRKQFLMEKVFLKKGTYGELVEDPFNLN
jgi:hypothetical protein